jgi:hypothetical protein
VWNVYSSTFFKTKFLAKQMLFAAGEYAFPHCNFGEAVPGQKQVLVCTVILVHCLELYLQTIFVILLHPCGFSL